MTNFRVKIAITRINSKISEYFKNLGIESDNRDFYSKKVIQPKNKSFEISRNSANVSKWVFFWKLEIHPNLNFCDFPQKMGI